MIVSPHNQSGILYADKILVLLFSLQRSNETLSVSKHRELNGRYNAEFTKREWIAIDAINLLELSISETDERYFCTGNESLCWKEFLFCKYQRNVMKHFILGMVLS